MYKYSLTPVGALLLSLLPLPQAQAEKLSELIPGLFGGDGIFLEDVIPQQCLDLGLSEEECNHAPHFVTSSLAQNNLLNDSIAGAIRPFPVTPSAGGITFTFDPTTGEYRQTTELLGPTVSERPQTLGRGKFNLGLALTYFEYDEFEGDSLSNIRAVAAHQTNVIPPPDVAQGFENDVINIRYDVDLEYTTLAFIGTYGFTDRFDVSVVVPVVRAEMDVKANATLEPSPLNPDPSVHQLDDDFDSASESATGIGDVLVGAKYLWLDEQNYDVAGIVRVKLETGDEDDFLGTGSTTIQPFVAASRKLTDYAELNTNLGVEFDLDDSDRSAGVYSVGVYGGNTTITGTVDIVGRHRFDGDEDIIDASFGLKWRPAENFIFSANILTPLNDDGLRSDIISTVGFEYRN